MATKTFALKESINRFLDDGARRYTKKDLGAFGENDWVRIDQCLEEWQKRGLLKIVRPLNKAGAWDVVIEMLDYIDQRSPWPNWPVKRPAK